MSEMLEFIQKRRSVYGINDSIPFSDDALQKLLGDIVLDMPTAFNMQNTRMVLLLGQNHKRLWEIVHDALRKVSSGSGFEKTEQKIAGFAAGHGSILFCNDTAVTEEYAAKFKTYAQNFPLWAYQQNGMLQFAVWTALAEKNVGASLQHYNPLIDEQVRKEWSLPESWELLAQMPFGGITQKPEGKDRLPLEQRFLVFD